MDYWALDVVIWTAAYTSAGFAARSNPIKIIGAIGFVVALVGFLTS